MFTLWELNLPSCWMCVKCYPCDVNLTDIKENVSVMGYDVYDSVRLRKEKHDNSRNVKMNERDRMIVINMKQRTKALKHKFTYQRKCKAIKIYLC